MDDLSRKHSKRLRVAVNAHTKDYNLAVEEKAKLQAAHDQLLDEVRIFLILL